MYHSLLIMLVLTTDDGVWSKTRGRVRRQSPFVDHSAVDLFCSLCHVGVVNDLWQHDHRQLYVEEEYVFLFHQVDFQ